MISFIPTPWKWKDKPKWEEQNRIKTNIKQLNFYSHIYKKVEHNKIKMYVKT